ncbi:MAG: hypothetical protein GY730_04975, partial [bacterium]|nr:hypothetical protein [bacterium]
SFLLTLPVPVYRTIIKIFINYIEGFSGFYIRALFYSKKLNNFKGNILIEKHVILKNPSKYTIDRFVYIDIGSKILCDELVIESGCHLALNSLITGGGKVVMKKYSGLGVNSTIISATEVIQEGHRHSGPMIPNEQRNIFRPTTTIERDAWSTTNVTILPGITLGAGAVVTPGSVVNKNIKPWMVMGPERIKKYGKREEVKFSDPQYD